MYVRTEMRVFRIGGLAGTGNVREESILMKPSRPIRERSLNTLRHRGSYSIRASFGWQTRHFHEAGAASNRKL